MKVARNGNASNVSRSTRDFRLLALLLAVAAQLASACQTAAGGDPAFTTEACSDTCANIAAVDCGDIGSGCLSTCVSHPNATYTGDCPAELEHYLDCFWLADSFNCDGQSRTVPIGCNAELVAYDACRSSPGAAGASGASGAGGAAATEP
jgi:hypothetical protein